MFSDLSISPFKEISITRNELFKTSHNWDGIPDIDVNCPSTAKKISCWIGHKMMTVISIPSNIIEIGIGAIGFSAGIVLGTIKITIFACSLLQVKPEFSTGLERSSKIIGAGVGDMICNFGEVLYDAGNIPIVIIKRLWKGFIVAKNRENGHEFMMETPWPINLLDNMTATHRIDSLENERHMENVLKHYAFSIINIPANILSGCVMGVTSVALSIAFSAKVIIYAATNIEIPIPTLAGRVWGFTAQSLQNASVDILHGGADIFVVMYRIAALLRFDALLRDLEIGAMRVIRYIPEAFN